MKIVLASGNQKKLAELSAILAPDWSLIPQSDLAVPEAEETGLTFVENALIKARNAAEITGLPALADDSGLCVDALSGAPGIYSSRFSGANATDADNNATLLEKMRGKTTRSAHFYCCIVFLEHAADPKPVIATGSWTGEILSEPRGSNGFGYDPLFYLPKFGCTSAELDAEKKNHISHRGIALAAFRERITAFDYGS